jgi:hypothetical protein
VDCKPCHPAYCLVNTYARHTHAEPATHEHSTRACQTACIRLRLGCTLLLDPKLSVTGRTHGPQKTRPLGPPIHTGRRIQTDAGHVKNRPCDQRRTSPHVAQAAKQPLQTRGTACGANVQRKTCGAQTTKRVTILVPTWPRFTTPGGIRSTSLGATLLPAVLNTIRNRTGNLSTSAEGRVGSMDSDAGLGRLPTPVSAPGTRRTAVPT